MAADHWQVNCGYLEVVRRRVIDEAICHLYSDKDWIVGTEGMEGGIVSESC